MIVTAKSQIKHDGKIYEKGDTLPPLTSPALAQLEENEVVEVTQDTPAKKVERKEAKKQNDKKQSEKNNSVEACNITPKKNMGQKKLIGIGRARGLTIKKTVTRDEAYAIVKADVDERGDLDVTTIKNPE